MTFDFILENIRFLFFQDNRLQLHRQAALASTQRQTQGTVSKEDESTCRVVIANLVCGIATPSWFDKSQHDCRTSTKA